MEIKVEKHGDKYYLYKDNDKGFEISEEEYLELGIYRKEGISPEELDFIKNETDYKKAKSIAVRYLATKLRTKSEIIKKLLEKGFCQMVSERVVEYLTGLGYINDLDYAQKLVKEKARTKASKSAVEMLLKRKGIERDIQMLVLSQYPVDEEAAAFDLLKKKYRTFAGRKLEAKTKEKIMRYLIYKGFNIETSKKAINSLEDPDYRQD